MRRWPSFRFHLSTALLLMVTAALLLFLNFRRTFTWDSVSVEVKQVRPPGEYPVHFLDFRLFGQYRIEYGWPCRILTSTVWDTAPLACGEPVEVPQAWCDEAVRTGQSQLTFYLDPGEAARLFSNDAAELSAMTSNPDRPERAFEQVWLAVSVVFDALAGVGILLLVGVCAEWLQRRRKAAPTKS